MMPPSSLPVPEMSDGFTLFSCFMPYFTFPFTSPFSVALRAVKKLWLEEMQVVGQGVTAGAGDWLSSRW